MNDTSNTFHSTHLENIGKRLYLNNESADVYFSFIISEHEIVRVPAHIAFLENGSSVFKSMFRGDIREEGDVKIEDASADGFKEFLQFFYFRTVQLTFENVAEVLYLANKYDVTECLNVCEKFIKEKLTNFSDLLNAWELAILLKRNELKAFLEEQIRSQVLMVFSTEKFKCCSKDTLTLLLNIENLDCEPKDIFDACFNWATQACINSNKDASVMDNVREELGECFDLIPFSLMDSSEIADCVTQRRGFFNREELEDFITMLASDKPAELKKIKRSRQLLNQWDSSNIISFVRSGPGEISKFNVNQIEKMSFRVQKNMKFGGFSTPKIKRILEPVNIRDIRQSGRNNAKIYKLNGTLTITRNLPNKSILASKILLKQPVSFFCNQDKQTITFKQVILVKPKYEYDVQIAFNNWAYQTYSVDAPPYNEKLTMGQQTIHFINNNDLYYDYQKFGIISRLNFNDINSIQYYEMSTNRLLLRGAFAVLLLIGFSLYLALS